MRWTAIVFVGLLMSFGVPLAQSAPVSSPLEQIIREVEDALDDGEVSPEEIQQILDMLVGLVATVLCVYGSGWRELLNGQIDVEAMIDADSLEFIAKAAPLEDGSGMLRVKSLVVVALPQGSCSDGEPGDGGGGLFMELGSKGLTVPQFNDLVTWWTEG